MPQRMRRSILWPSALAIVLAAAVLFTARPTYDPDLFWHLAHGRAVLSGHIVRTNLLSATAPDYPQPYTSWGFETVLAGAVAAWGMVGVQLTQTLLLAAALLMLSASVRVRHTQVSALAVLLLSLWVIEPRAMPRPYLVSFVGLSMCAWAIERWSVARAPRTWALLSVFAVWANFHSEAVFGVGLIALFGVCEWLRPSVLSRAAAARVTGIAALGALATLVTPYGIGLWRYLLENMFVPQVLRIAELQPATPQAYPAFFVYLAVLAALFAVEPRRLRLWEVTVAVVFAALGVRFIRFTPMVVFVTAPMLASRLDALMQKGWDRRAVLVTVFAIMVVTAPASPMRLLRAWRIGASAVVPADVFSPEAVAFARAHALSGPVFTSMNLGGYVAWELPDARVFVDSRLQAYPPQHFTAVLDASASSERWRALVRGVDWAVVSLARPNDMSGVGQFASEEWASVFRDRAVEILVRRSGRFAASISR